MKQRKPMTRARQKRVRVYKPSKFGEGLQPGTVEWEMVRRQRAKAAKAKVVREVNATLLGWDLPGLSLLVLIPALLFALTPIKPDTAPLWQDNYLYTAPAAGSQRSLILRDDRGRIVRSRGAREAFKRKYPCPSTDRGYGACPGYIIDHIEPLACGGADQPFNMQWQTITAASAKDKTELSCR